MTVHACRFSLSARPVHTTLHLRLRTLHHSCCRAATLTPCLSAAPVRPCPCLCLLEKMLLSVTNLPCLRRKVALPRMKNRLAYDPIFIFRLKLYVCRVNLYNFKLQLYRFRLEINFSSYPRQLFPHPKVTFPPTIGNFSLSLRRFFPQPRAVLRQVRTMPWL